MTLNQPDQTNTPGINLSQKVQSASEPVEEQKPENEEHSHEPKVPIIKESIKVDIRSRKEKFFQGDAHTVSSLNDTGEFDVLPKHANFVTLIKGYIIVDRGLSTEKRFTIDNGVLAAKTNAVDIYLEF